MEYPFDINKVLSKNRIINFIEGARGIGKTYGCKLYVAKRFIEKGEQFTFIRSTSITVDKITDFWGTIPQNEEFVGHDFTQRGRNLYIDNKQAGYLMSLSDFCKYKSIEFPLVRWMIYDEYLESGGRWPSKTPKPEALLNILDSVQRNRDNVQVLCLSNAVSYVNEFFKYLHITVNNNQEWTLGESYTVWLIKDSAESFIAERQQSKFGKLITGTHYADMALSNESDGVSMTMILQKPKRATQIGTLVQNNNEYGVWYDADDYTTYISKKSNNKVQPRIAVDLNSIDEDTRQRRGIDTILLLKLKNAAKQAAIYYDTRLIREEVRPILIKLGILFN